MTDTTLSSPPPAPFRARWWQPLLFWLLVNAWGFVERGGQPFAGHAPSPLQPPGWVFPVVWFSLNIVQIRGDLRLLDPARPIRRRRVLLALQAASWAVYATFTLVYFTLGSPILAAAWTIGFFALSSVCVALVVPDDRRIAALWLPLILWTGFASVVGVDNALLNPDPLFGTPAPWPR